MRQGSSVTPHEHADEQAERVEDLMYDATTSRVGLSEIVALRAETRRDLTVLGTYIRGWRVMRPHRCTESAGRVDVRARSCVHRNRT